MAMAMDTETLKDTKWQILQKCKTSGNLDLQKIPDKFRHHKFQVSEIEQLLGQNAH